MFPVASFRPFRRLSVLIFLVLAAVSPVISQSPTGKQAPDISSDKMSPSMNMGAMNVTSMSMVSATCK